jgi:hypothetical protein
MHKTKFWVSCVETFKCTGHKMRPKWGLEITIFVPVTQTATEEKRMPHSTHGAEEKCIWVFGWKA